MHGGRERRKEKGERRKEKGERRKEKGERRKEKRTLSRKNKAGLYMSHLHQSDKRSEIREGYFISHRLLLPRTAYITHSSLSSC
jgi:hypothetical protein